MIKLTKPDTGLFSLLKYSRKFSPVLNTFGEFSNSVGEKPGEKPCLSQESRLSSGHTFLPTVITFTINVPYENVDDHYTFDISKGVTLNFFPAV